MLTLSILARGCMSRGPVSGPQVLTPLPGVVKALASPSWLGYLVPTSMRAVATAATTPVEVIPALVTNNERTVLQAKLAALEAKLKREEEAREAASNELVAIRQRVMSASKEDEARYLNLLASVDRSVDRHTERITFLESQIRGVLSGLSTRAKLTLESFMSFVKSKSLILRDDRRSVPKATFGFDLLDRITERHLAFVGILSCLELYHRRLANGGTRAPIPTVCGGPGSGKSLIINCVAFRGVFKGTEVTEFTRALSQMTPEFRGWYESVVPITVTFNDNSNLTAGEKHPHQSLVTRLLWSYFIESEAPFSKFRQHFEEEFHEVLLEDVLSVIEVDSGKARSDILVVVDELAKLNRRFTDRYNDQSAAEFVMHELSASTVPLVWSSLDIAGVRVMKTASDRRLDMVMAAGLSQDAMQAFIPDLRSHFAIDWITARAVSWFIGGVPRVLVTALSSNTRLLSSRTVERIVEHVASTYAGSIDYIVNSDTGLDAAIAAFATPEQVGLCPAFTDELLKSGLLVSQNFSKQYPVKLPLFYAYVMFKEGSLLPAKRVGEAAYRLALHGLNPGGKGFEDIWLDVVKLAHEVEFALHERNRSTMVGSVLPVSFSSLLCASGKEGRTAGRAFTTKLKPLVEPFTVHHFYSTSLPPSLLPNCYYCPYDTTFPGFDHLLTREGLDGKTFFMAMECKSGSRVKAKDCARKIALTLARHVSLHEAILDDRLVFAMVASAQGFVPPTALEIQTSLVVDLKNMTALKKENKETRKVLLPFLKSYEKQFKIDDSIKADAPNLVEQGEQLEIDHTTIKAVAPHVVKRGVKPEIDHKTIEAVASHLVKRLVVFVTRDEIRRMAGPSLSGAIDSVFENETAADSLFGSNE